ncbi:MAG: EutN/CcmL family microcompartment protein [candidate division KSB1 bacterium]|nr:EutN/CcmL family microcompartment protein [candidate division KSB1 bacterium]MDZ7274716.1 EutN/CcmL family microcompartment protein [candidate division KSB1 bacterium]MDZ7285541.1 EutN/CcmL family microcompartment protein [candidate division KSB1 bacterium]MDZ7298573.1 EutN/CcmL family microcompartment protein [candidate division KSB1 bacterium]MDZ7309420.1 EutN/CcmL family microcompartment protein [candidate division KSB1 bacterium]
MFLARVLGTIWATQKDASLIGTKMQIIQPLDRFAAPSGTPLIAVDTVGAGPGEMVFYVTAREATLPLRHGLSPVDASIVGIVDTIENY